VDGLKTKAASCPSPATHTPHQTEGRSGTTATAQSAPSRIRALRTARFRGPTHGGGLGADLALGREAASRNGTNETPRRPCRC
jgi:hypothetical protein